MQLKRDTDFAMRTLYCLNQNNDTTDPDKPAGLSLSEISMQTGVPRPTLVRLCEKLEAYEIIHSLPEENNTDPIYYSGSALLNVSLLDVIVVIEGSGEIFSVFDHRSVVYSDCGCQLQRVQNSVEKILNNASMKILFGTRRNIQTSNCSPSTKNG